MNFDSTYILLIFPAVFGFLAKRNKANTMYWPMALFYAIGGVFAFLMTKEPYYRYSANFGHQDVSLAASLYLILCFVILFEPIRRNRKGYSYCGSIHSKTFIKVCDAFIAISVLYVLFTLPHISTALSARDAALFHDEMLEGGFDISMGNPILLKIFTFQEFLRPIFIFLFSYSLADPFFKSKRKYVLGLSCLVPTLLHSIASSHRNVAVFSLFDFILCFLIFYKYYTPTIKRRVWISLSIVGGFVGIIVLFFAFARFSGTIGGDAISYSLYRYIGEPFVNFNTQLWGCDDLLWGNKSFTMIREKIGLDYIPVSLQRDYLFNLPYRIFYFYSIVGNFYMDYGFWGGIGLCVLISLFFNKVINGFFKTNTITRLLVIFLFTSFTIKNYFYFAFMGTNNVLFIWYCIFIMFVYKFLDGGAIQGK